MTASIRQETVLPHPPARVWRALTDPARLSRWLMPNDFRLELGATFAFDTPGWGRTRCAVLAVEPERLLRYSWVNPPLDTTVTWTLAPEGEGTRLLLEHAGFDLADPRQQFAWQGMGGGWAQIVGERLLRELAEP